MDSNIFFKFGLVSKFQIQTQFIPTAEEIDAEVQKLLVEAVSITETRKLLVKIQDSNSKKMKKSDFTILSAQAEALIELLERQKAEKSVKKSEEIEEKAPLEQSKSIFAVCTGGADKGQAPCSIM